MNKSLALAEAIRQHEATTTKLKARYSEAATEMAAAPGDAVRHAQLIEEMTGISTQLAGIAIGLQTLRQAHDETLIAETSAELAKSQADARKRIAGFVKKFEGRSASYEHVQSAADAFLDALRAHVEFGKSLRPDASAIAIGLWGPRATDHPVTTADAASGATQMDAAAVATVLRSAMQIVLGSSMPSRYLDTYVSVNDFAEPVSFADAHKANAEIVRRLEEA